MNCSSVACAQNARISAPSRHSSSAKSRMQACVTPSEAVSQPRFTRPTGTSSSQLTVTSMPLSGSQTWTVWASRHTFGLSVHRPEPAPLVPFEPARPPLPDALGEPPLVLLLPPELPPVLSLFVGSLEQAPTP